MSVGRFFLSLSEGLNSEITLSSRLLITENINFWEENIDSDAEESLDSINDLFDERADEIMEAVLDDDAREVAMSGYVGKKLIIRRSCDSCKQTLASEVVDLENDSYASSTQLADFVCDCFAILDFLEKEKVLLRMPVAKVAT